MMEPLVSICIPTYNGERWLRECMDSALRCTLPCEIIVVDDGSSDSTVTLARTYESDPRVKVFINAENRGLAGNWNRCLEIAKGEWIKFLFQDDVLQDRAIELMLENASEKDQLIAGGRNYIFSGDVPEAARNYYTSGVQTLERLAPGRDQFTAKDIVQLAAARPTINFIGEPSTVIFRRAVAKEIGPFDTQLKQLCDLEYWLRIAYRYGLKHVPAARIDFRIHSSSMTTSNTAARSFVSTYLDPVRVVAVQLFDKRYAPFRSQLSGSEMQRLTLWLRLRLYEAKKTA
jgi:glycosyltransferase involved in cell wall biosynthesis